jgi:hypothetical protein
MPQKTDNLPTFLHRQQKKKKNPQPLAAEERGRKKALARIFLSRQKRFITEQK